MLQNFTQQSGTHVWINSLEPGFSDGIIYSIEIPSLWRVSRTAGVSRLFMHVTSNTSLYQNYIVTLFFNHFFCCGHSP
jgi:hypothetical protein